MELEKSRADKIFTEIRGLKKEEQEGTITYRNDKVDNELIFFKAFKSVALSGFNALDAIDIKAIYLKMKELGWL
jgi:hypothetical protein